MLVHRTMKLPNFKTTVCILYKINSSTDRTSVTLDVIHRFIIHTDFHHTSGTKSIIYSTKGIKSDPQMVSNPTNRIYKWYQTMYPKKRCQILQQVSNPYFTILLCYKSQKFPTFPLTITL